MLLRTGEEADAAEASNSTRAIGTRGREARMVGLASGTRVRSGSRSGEEEGIGCQSVSR